MTETNAPPASTTPAPIIDATPAPVPESGGFPWKTVAMLAAVALGLWFFLKKKESSNG